MAIFWRFVAFPVAVLLVAASALLGFAAAADWALVLWLVAGFAVLADASWHLANRAAARAREAREWEEECLVRSLHAQVRERAESVEWRRAA